MRRPILNKLPSPPPGKTGWPWTEESPQLPSAMSDGSPWPKISIVTPSYNQGQFLEETIRSVLLQGYPNLEYIIIDGGSTDNSVEIIRNYESCLTYWESKSDKGQGHAINKGFAHASGQILAWLNSDDKFCPWAFQIVAEVFTQCPNVRWLTSSAQLNWNVNGLPISVGVARYLTRRAFYEGRYLSGLSEYGSWIQQESTFWSRTLWEEAGNALDENLNYALDLELWARFWSASDLFTIQVPLGGFRRHDLQKMSKGPDIYRQQAREILDQYAFTRRSRVIILLGRLLQRLTGRGGRKFGSKMSIIAYDNQNKRWTEGYQYRI